MISRRSETAVMPRPKPCLYCYSTPIVPLAALAHLPPPPPPLQKKAQTPDMPLNISISPYNKLTRHAARNSSLGHVPLSRPHFGPAFALFFFLFPSVFLSTTRLSPCGGVNIPDQQCRWHIPGESGADRAGSKARLVMFMLQAADDVLLIICTACGAW